MGDDLRTPDGVTREAIIRQAEATERVADALETQNRLLRELVDVQAHGGSR